MSAHARLAAADPVMANLVAELGRLSFSTRRRGRPRLDPYGMLLRSIVGQQVSTKAAAAIYDRVLELFGGRAPAAGELLAVEPAQLRAAGLSGRKVEYVRGSHSRRLTPYAPYAARRRQSRPRPLPHPARPAWVTAHPHRRGPVRAVA